MNTAAREPLERNGQLQTQTHGLHGALPQRTQTDGARGNVTSSTPDQVPVEHMGGAASLHDSEKVEAHVEQLDENFSQIAVAVRKQGIDGATLLEDTRKEMLDNLCVSKEIKLRLGSEIDRFRDAHAPVVYGQSCDYGSMPSVSDAVGTLSQ